MIILRNGEKIKSKIEFRKRFFTSSVLFRMLMLVNMFVGSLKLLIISVATYCCLDI